MFKKLALCTSVLLAACGGGDSGGDSGAAAAGSRVLGEMKDARIEGVTYPVVGQNTAAAGTFGPVCSGEHTYFETEDQRVRVYGSSAFSVTDFRVVAGMVSERLDPALAKFGITWNEFIAQRPAVNLDSVQLVAEDYYLYQQNPEEFHALIEGSTEFIQDAQSDPENAWAAWSALSAEEKREFVETIYVPASNALAELIYADVSPDIEVRPDPLSAEDVLLPTDKLLVCLNENMGGGMFGEGSQFGVQVPPNTSTYHSKVGEIFFHELVHFIQGNIANSGQNPFSLMPRWFTEGQAVYLSGQSIASADHHYTVNPVQILGFYDEMDAGVDASTAYAHYGLAYRYVHESNGIDSVVAMMQAMRSNTDTPFMWLSAHDPLTGPGQEYDEGLAFTRAFAEFMQDHTGAPMTIEQYRTGYHDYMNAW